MTPSKHGLVKGIVPPPRLLDMLMLMLDMLMLEAGQAKALSYDPFPSLRWCLFSKDCPPCRFLVEEDDGTLQ